MNLADAIGAHAQWKIKLRMFVEDGVGEYIAEDVKKDDKCALGQWIHGAGAKHADIKEFNDLKQHHAAFHQCAGQVIDAVQSGSKGSARVLLNDKFPGVSLKVTVDIKRLQKIL